MFWNADRGHCYGQYSRTCDLTGDDALVRLDAGWDGFMSSMPAAEDLVKMDANAIAELAGLNLESLRTPDLDTIITQSLKRWRVNPAGSLVNAVIAMDGSSGDQMFANLKEQSRVIAGSLACEATVERSFNTIRNDDRRPIRLSGDYFALTAQGEAATTLNALARAFRVWEAKNAAKVSLGMVKLPKVVYRGIRSNDLKDLPEEFAYTRHDDYKISAARRVEAYLTYLQSSPHALADISNSNILSFTSNENIAEMFTKNNGLVIAVDPSEAGIVSAWSTDEGLSGPDPVTGKQEREWILRVSNTTINPEFSRPHAEDHAFVTRNRRGIELLDGFTEARYKMNDINIVAFFQWNQSGRGGKVRYTPNVDKYNHSRTRAEFKNEFGFDPLPKTDADLSNLTFFKIDSTSRKRTEIPLWSPELDAKPGMAA